MSQSGSGGFDRSYKRGAIMGLTVAEAFILLSFCLLLLFAWWQIETERKSLIVADEIGKLDAQQKAAIVAGLSDGTFQAAQTLRAAGLDVADTKALENAAQYSRFMRDEDFQRLMKGVVKLSPETRLSLADAVEVTAEVALRAKLATVEAGDSTVEQIAGRLQTAARQQGALVTLLDDRLGSVIREAGGSIDAEGTITLPQAILFDSNNDRIKDPAFLRKLCVPWLETLRQSGMNISDLKIEGHASSEWAVDATKEQAYLNNLDLSQRRARNALALCLSEVKDPDALAWVREHLAAVGYSSARLIYGPDGTEDHDASRRVMFSVGLNQEGLIDDIRRDVTSTEALMSATGPARVIDGDTVEVKETSFRLSGIDAPEMGQLCRNKAGISFDCGEVARRGLEQAIAGKPIECRATEVDMYKRPIATCMVDGQDLAEVMIVNGYAVAFSRYSHTYVARAETAQQANVGIWKTDFQMPWEYRKDN
ncbi:thermonuclease family protein [Cypionkella psychrotolerans]|uniref:thermonuclease family protein n=1 Tax=Cypionkella psychrotolerans TaxID=1678131 RepID=UPI0006B4A271|nr:thermonuclease family protein [Cypionkella psychrotolerans]